jgi:hypothetical protein
MPVGRAPSGDAGAEQIMKRNKGFELSMSNHSAKAEGAPPDDARPGTTRRSPAALPFVSG